LLGVIRIPAAFLCSMHKSAEYRNGSNIQKSESPAPGREMRGLQGGQTRGGGRGPPALMSGQRMRARYRPSKGNSSNELQQRVPECIPRTPVSLMCPAGYGKDTMQKANPGPESPRYPGTVHAWLGFSASTERFEMGQRRVLNARNRKEAPGITLVPRPNSPERWPRNDARSP
jgi:hypothetical protein